MWICGRKRRLPVARVHESSQPLDSAIDVSAYYSCTCMVVSDPRPPPPTRRLDRLPTADSRLRRGQLAAPSLTGAAPATWGPQLARGRSLPPAADGCAGGVRGRAGWNQRAPAVFVACPHLHRSTTCRQQHTDGCAAWGWEAPARTPPATSTRCGLAFSVVGAGACAGGARSSVALTADC